MTDPIVAAARFIGTQLEWVRHAVDGTEPYAMRALDEIGDCARRMRSLVDGPAAQKYLGPCGAPAQVETTTFADLAAGERTYVDGVQCEGDVYGRVGASGGRCKRCGAEYDQGDRLIWLDDVRRDWLYHASEIADAYPIRAETIRVWLTRGLLVAHGEHQGRPLLKLGEVLDLAAGDAARREEARAARARRKAAKAANEGDEAA